jgi:hypothetical protein
MLVVWPFWECPHCHVRLIPADLFPVDENGRRLADPHQSAPAKPAPQREDVRQD